MDCLLVHPAVRSRGSTHFPVLPMGMFPMADHLDRSGFSCRILNTASEHKADSGFTIERYLEKNRPAVVGIGLHWYVHSHSALELARRVKEFDGGIVVVLGGYTATFFDVEILEKFPYVDAVVRGEGETAVAELAGNPDPDGLCNLPNVTARKNGAPVRSTVFECPSGALLDSLDFSNLDYMEHAGLYVADCSRSGAISYVNTGKPVETLFYMPVGRGCANNCSYCGGGAAAYRSLTGRTKPYLRPVEKVFSEMKTLSDKGIRTFYFEYDPFPSAQEYYVELFGLLRNSGIKAGANFSLWGLAGTEFLDAFAGTFDMERSCLCFVPKSGSEKIRALNKSNSYTNAEFMECIRAARARGIFPSVNFKAGQPGETRGDFGETIALAKELGKLRVMQSASLPPTDPGAPMFVNPEKYGVKMLRKNFMDFYDTYRDYAEGRFPAHPVGFETDHFTEKELLALRTKAYRFFYLRPSYIMNRKSKAAGTAGLWKYFKVFIATLLGIPSVAMKEEKS